MSKVQAAKTIIGALESGVKLCTKEGRQMAKGVRLARPRMNHTVATIDTKNGKKVVETVKGISPTDLDGCPLYFSNMQRGKWQEITEADGMVTTIWRGPKMEKNYICGPNPGTQRGWRKEYPNGIVEQFMDGGGAVYKKSCFDYYPEELSYMMRDKEGRSLIAIKNRGGLTIRAKDIELENGLKLDGRYYTNGPNCSYEWMLDNSSAPAGTDKGILYEVFTTVNKFLEELKESGLKKVFAKA
jgi:hypothetical protein